MKLKACFVLLVICTLISEVLTRRSRLFKSRGISGSKTPQDPRFKNLSLYDFLLEEPEVTHQKAHRNNQNPHPFTIQQLISARRKSWIIIYIFGSIALCMICCCAPSCSCGNSNTRHRQIKQLTDEFELIHDQGTSLSENQRSKSIEKLMTTQWTVENTTESSSVTNCWQFKVKDIKKKSEVTYQIQGEGFNEENGSSSIVGVLLFKGKGMGILFDKLYHNRRKAGQIGKFDLLIFEGFETDGVFEGQWYYRGFKTDEQHSGKMKIFEG